MFFWMMLASLMGVVAFGSYHEKTKDQGGITRRRRRFRVRKPIQEESIEAVESLINRIVKGVIVETRKRGD